MPQVLTTNAIILCAHQTPAQKNPPIAPLWSINGGNVLVEGDTGTFPTCPSIFPCGGYQLRSMGLNATQIAAKKVILVTDFNLTLSGLPMTMIETHPVFDNTTPVPIPDGQPAPPLPPEMTDLVKPVVSSSVTSLAFNKTSMTPSSVTVTFTLTSAHPLRWILTQIDEPENRTSDRTNVQPPGMTVSPSGGVWNVSPLSINLTMTAAFMATLLPLDHRFFLTGVTKRGLSSFAEVVLTVAV
ncbi:MAG: hypothetical protein C5B44_02770 [Acidobacteria bacterium]|nr:MAG: hypothetical protein C5B44_02770 [Acidobacteriota bacterium]